MFEADTDSQEEEKELMVQVDASERQVVSTTKLSI